MKISKAKNNGKVAWRVNVVHEGRQKRFFFKSESEAKTFVAQEKLDHRADWEMWVALGATERYDIITAHGQAKTLGVRLVDLVCFYNQHQHVAARSRIALGAAWPEFIASKGSQGLKPRSLAALRSTIIRLIQHLGETTNADTVRPEHIEAWLIGGGWQGRTRKGYLTDATTFFSWLKARGYCSTNPCDAVTAPIVDEKAPGIFTVKQAEKLLRAAEASDKGLIPHIAIGLFAGLRTSELEDLEWDRVGKQYIEVTADSAKSRRRRLVDVSPNLRAWLSLGGDLPGENLTKRINRVCLTAGIEWPPNALRHSFATYHLAQHQSAEKTALQLGHAGTDLLFRHYRELATREQAAAYWALKP